MKRIVSYLLAAVLVLAPCMSVYATGLDDAVESGGSATDQADTGDQQNTGNGPDESGQENTGDPPSATSEADITVPGSGEEEAGINLASEEEAKEADLNKGQVDVYIAQTLEWGEPVTFTVTLNGQNKEITLPSEGVREVQEGVTFDNLTEGLYALEVSAPGFATYKQ